MNARPRRPGAGGGSAARDLTPDERYGDPPRKRLRREVAGYPLSVDFHCPHCEAGFHGASGRRVGRMAATVDRHIVACAAITGIARHFGISYEAAKLKREKLWREYRAEAVGGSGRLL